MIENLHSAEGMLENAAEIDKAAFVEPRKVVVVYSGDAVAKARDGRSGWRAIEQSDLEGGRSQSHGGGGRAPHEAAADDDHVSGERSNAPMRAVQARASDREHND